MSVPQIVENKQQGGDIFAPPSVRVSFDVLVASVLFLNIISNRCVCVCVCMCVVISAILCPSWNFLSQSHFVTELFPEGARADVTFRSGADLRN